MASFFYADIKTDELQVHGHNHSIPAQIELLDANASNMVIIRAPLSLTQPNVIITLPSNVSTANSLMMNTLGNGELSFISPGGDISMDVTGSFTVNSLSNTSTITSYSNIIMSTDKQLQFRDSNNYISSNSTGDMVMKSDSGNIFITATGEVVILSKSNGTVKIINEGVNELGFIIEQTNTYINFGATTGSNGYGIRDNNGVLQIKNRVDAPIPLYEWSNIVTHLPNLGDVTISSLANNNILTYNTTSAKWVNQANVYVRGASDSNGLALIPGTDNRASLYVDWQPGTNIVSYPASLAISANGAVKWAAAFNNSKTGTSLTEYIAFARNGVKTGAISNNSTGTAYVTTSDYRLKSNVSPMTNGLDIVNLMNPVNFTWISTGANDSGFIAHELQTVVPSAVTGEKDELAPDGTPEYQGVDTSMLICYMVDAIKQLSSRVSQLESQMSNI